MENPGNVQLPEATAVRLGHKINDENAEKVINIARKKSIPVYKSIMNAYNGCISFVKI